MVRDSGRERPFALESSRMSGYDDPLEPGIWEMSVDKPKSGRIAVKVINHLGDKVMKVFRVE